MAGPGRARERLPAVFWAWLVATEWTSLGSQLLAFGLAWQATATSPAFAGLLVTVSLVPRVALAVVAGAVADRVGPARVLAASGAALAVVTVALAVVAGTGVPAPAVLLIAVLALGIVAAFVSPAGTATLRLLVSPAALTRGMATWQLLIQVTGLVAAPLGGVLVATAGLPGTALAAAAGGAGLAAVMAVLRRRIAATGSGGPARRERFVELLTGGFRVAFCDPLTRGLMITLIAVAGFVLPVDSLLVQLLARQSGWGPSAAGLVVGCFAVGSGATGLVVSRTGGSPRPGRAAAGGLALAAAGTAVLAVAPTAVVAGLAVLLVGAGTGRYTTHAAPLILGHVPPSHGARVQAVVLVAQALPLLVATSALGGLAGATSARWAVAVSAAGIAAAAALALAVPAVRTAVRPEAPDAPEAVRTRMR